MKIITWIVNGLRVLGKKVKNIEILSEVYGSDHCPIVLELK